MLYNVPISETYATDVSAWYPVNVVEKTTEYVSMEMVTSIPANESITFTIQQIDGSTGFTELILDNVVCSY